MWSFDALDDVLWLRVSVVSARLVSEERLLVCFFWSFALYVFVTDFDLTIFGERPALFGSALSPKQLSHAE